MHFNCFGEKSNPHILLIHGVLTPWQIWMPQIEYFQKKYYVIVPALDGHEAGKQSKFISIEEEAKKMEGYCSEHTGTDLLAVCGLSMGGAIAHLLWKKSVLKIQNLILDGASLVPYGRFMKSVMTKQYLDIVRKSKERAPKTLESFKKVFLPEKYLKDYLAFIDYLDEESMANMILSMSSSSLIINDISLETRILYLHGTKMNEMLSRKSAEQIGKAYPNTKVIRFDGCSHCEKVIYAPAQWIDLIEGFLNRE